MLVSLYTILEVHAVLKLVLFILRTWIFVAYCTEIHHNEMYLTFLFSMEFILRLGCLNKILHSEFHCLPHWGSKFPEITENYYNCMHLNKERFTLVKRFSRISEYLFGITNAVFTDRPVLINVSSSSTTDDIAPRMFYKKALMLIIKLSKPTLFLYSNPEITSSHITPSYSSSNRNFPFSRFSVVISLFFRTSLNLLKSSVFDSSNNLWRA